MNARTTFRSFEKFSDPNPSANTGDSPLETWYRSVRDKPVGEFSCNDLCKACRQGIYPSAVVPVAIEFLKKEPLAGDMYDGELLMALKSLDPKYWSDNPRHGADLRLIIQSASGSLDDDLRTDLDAFALTLPEEKMNEDKRGQRRLDT